jgi:hypothetical protein
MNHAPLFIIIGAWVTKRPGYGDTVKSPSAYDILKGMSVNYFTFLGVFWLL